MSRAPGKKRAGLVARRFGYAVAVIVNAALLVALNTWPGWDALSFMTADTERVLGLVNASLAVSLVANVAYLVRDPVWFKALGDIVTTSVGLAATWRVWRVFPFDLTSPWETLVRVLLVVGIVGSVLGILVGLATLVKDRAHASPE